MREYGNRIANGARSIAKMKRGMAIKSTFQQITSVPEDLKQSG